MSDDLRDRYAQALAAKFTKPSHRSEKIGPGEWRDWVENPEPADRVGQSMWVQFTAADGDPAMRGVTCEEAADVCADVRDEELERLQEERDQAIAHDRQPYPTAWAYEQACKALHAQRARAEQAEAKLARVRELHHIHRCETDGHVLTRTPNPCVNDGVCQGCGAAKCRTLAALDGIQEDEG